MNDEQIIKELKRLEPHIEWQVRRDPSGNPHGELVICKFWAEIEGLGFTFDDLVWMNGNGWIDLISKQTRHAFAREYYGLSNIVVIILKICPILL